MSGHTATLHKQLLALWEALDGGPKPRCRDCADYNGRCPSDNLPCEPQERALEQITGMRDSHAELVKALEEARGAMEGWLSFAEEELGEFDLEVCDFNQTETLCAKCESSGCINLKIRDTRAALATLTARKVG